LVFLKRTRILSGIQFTTYFIEFVVVETMTKQFVGSNVNLILTPWRHTYGQRSSMSAGSKRRVLAFYFSIRIWYMFWGLKRKGESDQGLYTTSGSDSLLRFNPPGLYKRLALCRADFWQILRPNTFIQSEGGTTQPNSICKFWSCAQTCIGLFCIFWYHGYIANSYGKIEC